jgi:hypothetical protein
MGGFWEQKHGDHIHHFVRVETPPGAPLNEVEDGTEFLVPARH